VSKDSSLLTVLSCSSKQGWQDKAETEATKQTARKSNHTTLAYLSILNVLEKETTE